MTSRSAPPAGLDDVLAGIVVADFSQGIAGPYCAAMLAELGADVIKVEPPGGDWGRRAGGRVGESSAIFEAFNRGKRSIVLDLKTPAGQAEALLLADSADVLVENARVGVMDRLGLGYPAVAARNPRLVYTSISGFGQHGPAALRPATDTVMQAYTGISAAAFAGGPARLKLAIVDVVCGLYASQATLAALFRQARSGRGQWLDVNLTHAMAALQNYKIIDTLANGPAPDAEALAIVGLYPTRDGMLAISAASDAQVLAGLRALGCTTLPAEPRFATAEARHRNQIALREAVGRAIASRALDDCLAALAAAGVPAQRVLDHAAFVADPQVVAMRLFDRLPVVGGTTVPAVRLPGREPGAALRPAPRLDEHAASIRARWSGAGARHHEETT